MTSMVTSTLVSIRSIRKSFDGQPAVRGVSLDVARGEIVAVLGPSGCGKSTLLRILSGLEQPDEGEVVIDGQDVTRLPPYERPTNMMFQSYALFPHMTVEENVGFGLRQDRMEKAALRARVDQMLDLVRMQDFRRRRPAQLSGGQQQRVALARSLAQQPKLLLLDEPMGALDRKLRAEMQFEIVEILRRVQVTCLIVTHDQEEAMSMAGRIALMRAGEIVQTGPPREVYDRPNSRFAAEFLGEVNLLQGAVTAVSGSEVRVAVPELGDTLLATTTAPVEEGATVTVALRPERVRLGPPDAGTRPGRVGVVQDLAYLGTYTTCQLRLPSGRVLKVVTPGEGALEAGQQVAVSSRVGDAVVLGA
jgi:putrescine transport system ATP-binding protein